MSKRMPVYVLILSVVLLGMNSSAEAGGYVLQSNYAPVAIAPVYSPVYAPVYSPVNVIYPVAYPPVVQTSYYAPAPVYTYRPAYVAPAPVYVPTPTYVEQSVRVTRNRVAVRAREYSPYSRGPYSRQVYTQRLTPRGIVVRHRGF